MTKLNKIYFPVFIYDTVLHLSAHSQLLYKWNNNPNSENTIGVKWKAIKNNNFYKKESNSNIIQRDNKRNCNKEICVKRIRTYTSDELWIFPFVIILWISLNEKTHSLSLSLSLLFFKQL